MILSFLKSFSKKKYQKNHTKNTLKKPKITISLEFTKRPGVRVHKTQTLHPKLRAPEKIGGQQKLQLPTLPRPFTQTRRPHPQKLHQHSSQRPVHALKNRQATQATRNPLHFRIPRLRLRVALQYS